MLETNDANSTLALQGINQQDFAKLQRVSGTYPKQEGLQARIPGKGLIQIYSGGVGSIFIFYMVFGRIYTFVDFGSIAIDEIKVPPITLPALPPTGNKWYDSFGSYLVDTISRLWPGGAWLVGIGVCETIIEGTIDFFDVRTSGLPTNSIPSNLQPHSAPPVDTPPVSPILPPVGPRLPVNCGTLPSQNFQVLATGTYFSNIQQKGGSYDSGEYTPQDLPYPDYHSHPYNNQAGSSLDAHEYSIRQSYYNGFANVSRSRSGGYYTSVDYNFNGIDVPVDATFWLVGTKSLSDGTGGLFPNPVTTCASLQLSTVGEQSGNFIISTDRGIFTGAADEGTTVYTQLRVYSATF